MCMGGGKRVWCYARDACSLRGNPATLREGLGLCADGGGAASVISVDVAWSVHVSNLFCSALIERTHRL